MEDIREMMIWKKRAWADLAHVTGYRKCESKTDQSSQISTTEKSGEVRMQCYTEWAFSMLHAACKWVTDYTAV